MIHQSLIQAYVVKLFTKPQSSSINRGAGEKRSREYYHSCEVSDHPHPAQKTDMYEDSKENRLHKAQDMGWGHPFWAKLKAQDLVATVSELDVENWVMFTIPHDKEDLFQICIKKEADIEYLLLRSGTPDNDINTIFFVNRSNIHIARRKAIEILKSKINFIETKKNTLISTLPGLLDFKLHHDLKSVGRWSSSELLSLKLRAARVTSLVKKARKGEPYILCEDMPDNIDFISRLSAYLMAEKTVLGFCSPKDKFNAVEATGLLSSKEISSLKSIMLQLIKESKDWKSGLFYTGMPKFMSTEDAKEGFQITESRLWCMSKKVIYDDWDLEMGPPNDAPDECPSPAWIPD